MFANIFEFVPKTTRIAGIGITNPERLVYPNHRFTKLHLVEYYDRVAPYILPHLRNRPVTLKRYTDTTTGPWFYEKDAPAFTPQWVRTFPVWRRTGESQINYIIINDGRTLVWAANIGTIEIHPFLAREPKIELPDFVVFDLDPGEGANILACARVSLLLRDLLNQLGLQSCAKVSGSKGLQVYVPLNTPTTYAITQTFAKTVSELLHAEHPDLIVSGMQRSERRDRVFIDWSQNADFKTTIGAYSLRAKRHRPFVSLPVTWDELTAALKSGSSSALYWLANAAIDRLQSVGDLFAPVLGLQQSLPESFVEKLRPVGQKIPKLSKLPRLRSAPAKPTLELPRASAQGGRRRFLLRRRNAKPENAHGELSSKDRALDLALESGDDWLCWSFPKGLPDRDDVASASESPFCISDEQFDSVLREARRQAPTSSLSYGVSDLGTYEVVEGDLAQGYAHLFFSGRELHGDFFLVRSQAETGRWTGSRKPQPFPIAKTTSTTHKRRALG
ncbi:MAG TPA: non-homologous end-joining DNA ligase [Terriglobales bacterium]|nr:non-homologous end-joining DNA ligase [Terriglobales bacterium]